MHPVSVKLGQAGGHLEVGGGKQKLEKVVKGGNSSLPLMPNV